MTGQLLEIQLNGGLDEKTARKLVPPGSFLDLVNTRFDLMGQIAQRYGTVRLDYTDTDGNSIQPPRAGHGFRGAPVLVTDDRIYSFSNVEAHFVNRGRISTPQLSRKAILQLGATYASVDHAYYSGLHFVVVEDAQPTNHRILVGVIDDASGTWIRGLEQLGGSNDLRAPRIFICGTRAVVVYHDGTSNTLFGHTLNLAALSPLAAWSAATAVSIAGDANAGPAFDAKPVVGHANRLFLAYAETSNAAKRVTASIYDSSNLGAGPVSSSQLTQATVTPAGIGVYARNGDSQFWVGWSDFSGANGRLKYTAVNTGTCVENFAAQIIRTALLTTDGIFDRIAFCPTSTTQAVCWATQGLTVGTTPSTVVAGLSPAAFPADVLSVTPTYWVQLLSQPWIAPATESNRQYACVQLYSTAQSSNYVVELDVTAINALARVQIAGRYAVRQTGQSSASRAEIQSRVVPNVPNPQTGRYYTLHNIVITGSGTGQRVQLAKTTIEFEPPTRHRGGEYRQTLHLGGGVPQVFDGQRAYEEGFHWYPEIQSITLVNPGGNLQTGNYLACACYRFTFASGEILRSAPSLPFAFTATANDFATYNVRSYTAGALRAYSGGSSGGGIITEVAIELYRTQVGGQTFNLIDSAVLTSANANNPAAATVAIVDTQSDATIAVNLPLYTDGTPSPLENLCPPSLYPIAIHMGRAWGIDESRRRVWYCDKPVPGEAARWHEIQSIDIDEGEDLVGFIPLDGVMCVGSASRIFRLDGEPSDRLGNGTLTYSQISSSAGMGGIFFAKFDAGTMFQAPNGEIKMLTRGFEIKDIGYTVQPTALANPFMVSGVSHGTERELRFVIGDAQSPTKSVVVVYETERQQWLKRTYNETGTATQLKIKDAWLVGSTWYFVAQVSGPTTVVWYENAASGLDSEEDFVEATLGFPFVSFEGIQGYQRCRYARVQGDHFSPCDVEMKIFHDGSETATATRTFDDPTYGALDPYEIEHSPLRQKSSRFRVQVKTKAPATSMLGSGKGITWQSIAFMIDKIPGGRRTRPAVRG